MSNSSEQFLYALLAKLRQQANTKAKNKKLILPQNFHWEQLLDFLSQIESCALL